MYLLHSKALQNASFTLLSFFRALNLILQRMNDKDRPDEAFTTDRAVRAGRANASSGRIMVTVPGDWFGPIPPEHDPRGLVSHNTQDFTRPDCRNEKSMSLQMREHHATVVDIIVGIRLIPFDLKASCLLQPLPQLDLQLCQWFTLTALLFKA